MLRRIGLVRHRRDRAPPRHAHHLRRLIRHHAEAFRLKRAQPGRHVRRHEVMKHDHCGCFEVGRASERVFSRRIAVVVAVDERERPPRARLAEALDKLPAQGELVLTSEDGTIARYAAAELSSRRPFKVLAGGTAAWKAAGLPLETGMGPLASEPDDVALSARERPSDRERYMREYLAWEIDLVNQIARDEDCRFRLVPVA